MTNELVSWFCKNGFLFAKKIVICIYFYSLIVLYYMLLICYVLSYLSFSELDYAKNKL